MYVCLCHGVTDRAIRQAARDGVSSFEELQQRSETFRDLASFERRLVG